MKESNTYQKYFKFFIFITLLAFSYLIIKPFINTIISAIVIALIFYPVYELVKKGIKTNIVAASLVTFMVIILIILPTIGGASLVAKESYKLYIMTKQRIYSGNILNINCYEVDSALCTLNNQIKEWLSKPQNRYYIEDSLTKITNFIFEKASEFIASLPRVIFNLFVMFFMMFFLLKDGDKIINFLRRIFPLSKTDEHILFHRVQHIISATLYGSIVIAIIQGIVAGIGYAIFGLQNPILLGLFTAFAALVPYLGTGLVYVPLSLSLIITGMGGETKILMNGILLLLYGILIISTIDNFIRPKLIGDKAKIHPVLVLVGAFGGIATIGTIGIFVGPIILVTFITFLEYYANGKSAVKT